MKDNAQCFQISKQILKDFKPEPFIVQREPFLTKCYTTNSSPLLVTIGFLGQIRQISSQFHFHVFELELFCLSSCYCVSNSEIGHSVLFESRQITLAQGSV